MVLYADVIIHFIKAGCFSKLFKILPTYEYIILSQVYNELKIHHTQIDNQIIFFKDLRIENYSPTGNAMVEFFRLTSTMGRCESACREQNENTSKSILYSICILTVILQQ